MTDNKKNCDQLISITRYLQSYEDMSKVRGVEPTYEGFKSELNIWINNAKRKVFEEEHNIETFPQFDYTCSDNELSLHLPGYFTVDDSEFQPYKFNTLEEMLDTPVCRKWSSMNGFKEFRISNHHHLMAVFKDNKYWVCAYVKFPKRIDLSEFNANDFHIE